MGADETTRDRSGTGRSDGAGPATRVPGMVLIFTGGQARAVAIELTGGELVLGRDHLAFAPHPDLRMSRRHALVRFHGQRFWATDLGSRNGTAADGEALTPEVPHELSRVLRVGDSLLVPTTDVDPLRRLGVRIVGERVEGPATQEALQAAARAAQSGSTLHVTGESGAGKEALARAFHAAGPKASGHLEAVNCATIPEGVAERLLFGTKKGAYSGADTDAEGYVQAAHGGSLFLDEVAELSLAVQAKLLRVLETGEVLPLGATRTRRVDLRFCSATHRDLRTQVAAGKLREDLYFRIATPRVVAPPLRDRPEEFSWLLQQAIAAAFPGLAVHVSLVEACLLRPWPGNVRELLAEARSAGQAAVVSAAQRVEAHHLNSRAGSAFSLPAPPVDPATGSGTSGPSLGPNPTPPNPTPPNPTPPNSTLPPTRARLVGLLRRNGGNISAAARELGVHRTQLRRWMDRHNITAQTSDPPTGEDPD